MTGNPADGEQLPQVRPGGSHAATLVGTAIWRHRTLVTVLTLLCAALAGVLTIAKDPGYTAEARVFLSSAAPFDGVGDAGFVNDPDRYVGNQASLAASDPVLSRAARGSGVDADVSELRKLVDVIPSRGMDMLVVTAEGTSASQAAARANAVAAAYRSLSGERVKTQAAQLAALAASTADRAAVLQRAASFGDGVAVLEEAQTPDSPSSPNLAVDVLLGVLVGLGLSSAGALALELGQGRRRSAAAAAAAAGSVVPARAAVPGEPARPDGAGGEKARADTTGPQAKGVTSVGV